MAQPSSLSVPPITLRSTYPPRRKSPNIRTKRPSPRSVQAKLRDSPPPPLTPEGAQFTPPPPSPHLQQSAKTTSFPISVPTSAVNSPQLATGHTTVTLPGPSVPPSTPVPGPSKSVIRALSAVHPSPFRPSIPGAFLSPSTETPVRRLPHIPQTPQTEPRPEAVRNPYYRSMAPPPSPNLPLAPTPQPQPPDSGSSVEPLPSSTTASTSASTSTLPASREVVDAAIAVAEKKLAGRMVRKVFSRKGARQHIYQSAVSACLSSPCAHLYRTP